MSDKHMKILMLHGHGQSAQRFRPKARYIEKAFRAFANGRDVSFSFQYLSGILPAYPDKIDNTDQWVWGYGDPEDDEIKKMELSIKHILDTLDREDDGPFAGIVGFSSGGAMAAVVASLLEKGGRINDLSLKTHHPKLKFILCLSGFRLGPAYESIYVPPIATPTLLAIGASDPVISPAQTRSLAERCQFPTLFNFAGTHYVPQVEEFPKFSKILADFLHGVLDSPRVNTATDSKPASAQGEGRRLVSVYKNHRESLGSQKATMAIQHIPLTC